MKLWIISLITYIIPLTLHCIGIVLLLTKSSNVSGSQTIFMINLSVSEISLSITGALAIGFYELYGGGNFAYQLSTIGFLSSAFTYYPIMYILTLDRLAEVYLNLRYQLYWSAKKTKVSMILVWLISATMFLSFLVYIRTDQTNGCANLVDVAYEYVYPLANFLYIIIALLTYIYIVRKIRQKRKIQASISISIASGAEKVSAPKSSNNSRTSTQRKKARSFHLLLPSLLILTFVFFIAIPDLVAFLAYLNIINHSFSLTVTINVMYSIGLASDALIYVLLSTSCKNYLRRKYRKFFNLWRFSRYCACERAMTNEIFNDIFKRQQISLLVDVEFHA